MTTPTLPTLIAVRVIDATALTIKHRAAVRVRLNRLFDHGKTVSHAEDTMLPNITFFFIFVNPSRENVDALLLPVCNEQGVDLTVERQDTEESWVVRQTELTNHQLERQDIVDNAVKAMLDEAADIFDLNVSDDEWSIDNISRLREIVTRLVCDDLKLAHERVFYPYLQDDNAEGK